MTADKKKFGVMCGLLGVGLLLWARLLILEDVPRTSFADPAATGNATAGAAATGAVSLDELPVVEVEASRTLARDLFAPQTEFLAQIGETESTTQPSVNSETDPSEDPSEVERRRVAAITEAAESLRLESLIRGSAPIAIVNGEVLRLGGRIDGFTLISVHDQHIVLEKDGVRVDVEMETPATKR
ncbi:MAG: hypothetical protein ACF8PN_15850 [Phycisphaerales bacterium]